MMERIPRPGEFYRHFKDKLYQIITIARHSETEELMVVYQALYGDFTVYVRPLEMFVSPVDREKYPDAAQEYRFEWVEIAGAGRTPGAPLTGESGEGLPADGDKMTGEVANVRKRPLSPLVVPFVEAENYEQKLALLTAMRGEIGQEELDVLAVSLDLPQRDGTVEQQLDALEKYLQMQFHFDGKRLR